MINKSLLNVLIVINRLFTEKNRKSMILPLF